MYKIGREPQYIAVQKRDWGGSLMTRVTKKTNSNKPETGLGAIMEHLVVSRRLHNGAVRTLMPNKRSIEDLGFNITTEETSIVFSGIDGDVHFYLNSEGDIKRKKRGDFSRVVLRQMCVIAQEYLRSPQ